MKTDRFTKTLLCIIAACLLFNVFHKLELIPTAQASQPGIDAATPSSAFSATQDVRITNTSEIASAIARQLNEIKIANSSDLARSIAYEINRNVLEVQINGTKYNTPVPVQIK